MAHTVFERKYQKMEYILIVILLISALFIVAAVLMQKSDSEGLSGALSGRQETYYGNNKSARLDKVLFKWTAIASIVFAVAVLLAYVIQPDYKGLEAFDYWEKLTSYSSIFS